VPCAIIRLGHCIAQIAALSFLYISIIFAYYRGSAIWKDTPYAPSLQASSFNELLDPGPAQAPGFDHQVLAAYWASAPSGHPYASLLFHPEITRALHLQSLSPESQHLSYLSATGASAPGDIRTLHKTQELLQLGGDLQGIPRVAECRAAHETL
jgi:hypothetical protein